MESSHLSLDLKRQAGQEPVYARVVKHIQEMVRQGELAPGDQLLPERELAEKLHVSRSSAREALAVLTGMGIIEVSARDGAYIRRRSFEEAIEPLASVIFQEQESVLHLFEVRQIIETQAARLAAERHSEADLKDLQTLNQQVEQDICENRPADESDTHFHLGIVKAAKNPLLTKVMGSLITALMDVYAPTRRQILADPLEAPLFVSEHQQILDAIAARNPDQASEAIIRHLAHARQQLEAFKK